jgi:hypothetical protein
MNRLKFFMGRAGFSAAELARRVGATQPEIWRLAHWPEPGGRKMSREWADRLAPVLGVAPPQLLYKDFNEMMGMTAPLEALAEREFIERFLPVIEATVVLICDLFRFPVETPEAKAVLAEGIARLLARRPLALETPANEIRRLKRELQPTQKKTIPAKPRLPK